MNKYKIYIVCRSPFSRPENMVSWTCQICLISINLNLTTLNFDKDIHGCPYKFGTLRIIPIWHCIILNKTSRKDFKGSFKPEERGKIIHMATYNAKEKNL